ncbi:MAG: hypothetical protein JXR03_17660 [Cyclobacteriaceae bacterium]
MKNLSLYSVLILLFAFTACEQDGAETDMEEIIGAQTIAALDIESEEAIESSFSDIDVITEAGIDVLGVDLNSSGRIIGNRRGRDRKDRALDCAEITKDTVNQMITIDFGDGCVGPHGAIRKGKIIIQYSGNRFEAGASKIVTLEDFFIDSLHIEGTRTTTLVSIDTAASIKVVRTTMEGGKITFADETFATRDTDHTRTMVNGDDEDGDYSTLAGAASGVKRDGTEYSATILEDLLFKRICWEERVFIAVSGVKEVVNGESIAVIDYGDGTCDNEVEITADGETTTKTIEPKGRLKRKRG